MERTLNDTISAIHLVDTSGIYHDRGRNQRERRLTTSRKTECKVSGTERKKLSLRLAQPSSSDKSDNKKAKKNNAERGSDGVTTAV